jgi:hypothetical protein
LESQELLKRVCDFFLRGHTRLGKQESSGSEEALPVEIAVGGAAAFSLVQHLAVQEGYPIMDWDAAQAWIDKLEPADLRGTAWTDIERAWMLHMRKALGSGFRLCELDNAMLLSAFEPNVARATLDYMGRTLQRVVKVLDGIAQIPALGKDLLIVFDEDQSYYRYVSCYYPEAGEFGLSSGMHINAGCSHYVTVRGDLHAIEPVIAHEMTHGCLGHLPLPAWLNEGLAVNVEHRLAGTRSSHTPQQMRAKHLAFWCEEEVQQFWSGKSFLRADDGNLLSYDLARLIVEHMARNWEPFRSFVLAADCMDAGATAAREHLGVELGQVVCALLEREPLAAWSPDPAAWEDTPERGGFADAHDHRKVRFDPTEVRGTS